MRRARQEPFDHADMTFAPNSENASSFAVNHSDLCAFKTFQIDDDITKIQGLYQPRFISQRLERLAQSFPVVVVSGARQVGKSTLLKHVFGENAEMVVFDPSRDIGNARLDSDLFLDNHPAPIILDEIQYVPELVAALKRRVDQNRSPGQYLLTGSQQ